MREAITIKWALCCYKAWSDLKTNFTMSSLVCLRSTNVFMQVIREGFHCKEEEFPIAYLKISVKQESSQNRTDSPFLIVSRKSWRVGKENNCP